ncbi:hypothetical protein ACNOYE_08395 [Nannocystaceae bacterium ST9]
MSDPKRGESIDVGALLTIDVESELRKLTLAQLQGSWQLPAELVRRAIREGAQTIEVELGRQQLRVRSLGGAIHYDILREIAALLDPRREPERRHRALTKLEREGALALLGLIGLEPSGLRIVSAASRPGEPGWGLEWRRGGMVEVQRFEPAPTHTEVLVRGPKLERVRARNWLAEAARFAGVLAPVEILVDGRPLAQGFEDAIAHARIVDPMPGLLALPRTGEVARVILLQDGIVTGHLSVTEAPCFELALETRGLAEPGASAARLRELIEPQLDRLIEVAVDHMIELGREGAALAGSDRTRLSQQLLQAARRRREQAKTIARLPLFRGLERDGRERWYDLLALRQSVHEDGSERLLTAIFPDQELADFAPEGRVYVLDESERALLGELLELGFRQPRRRVGRHRSLAELLRSGIGVRIRDLFAALRPGGRAIPDAELDVDERHLLVQLRAQLEHCEVAMCTGEGPVRRRGAGPDKLLLPRGSLRVRAAVRTVAHDAGWVYPALLALLDGRDFPDRARRRWRLDSWRATG